MTKRSAGWKFMENQDKYEHAEPWSIEHAKAIHSFIHNLVQAYKEKDVHTAAYILSTILCDYEALELHERPYGELKAILTSKMS